MKLDRAPVTALLLLAALAAVQMAHYYPLLPERLAVHFGSSGEPNGWSSKTEFVLLMGAMEAMFVIFGLAFAVAMDKVPERYVNIPNRGYWFAPERRAETVEFVKDHVTWIEVASLGFLIALTQLIIRENLGDAPPRLPHEFWYVLTAFVVAALWLALRIVLRFASTKERMPSDQPPLDPPT
jgi:serine/threonine-protein kinase